MSAPNPDDLQLAERVITHLKNAGASDAAVTVARARTIECEVRDHKLEKLQQSQTAQLAVQLYIDGRFASHSTNDLRWSEVAPFLNRAVALTRYLDVDPFRKLPEPDLYSGRSTDDLGLYDVAQTTLTTEQRKERAFSIESAAFEAAKDAIVVQAGFSDGETSFVRLTSNGFMDSERSTNFSAGGEVTVRDGDKRPEDYWYVSARDLATVPDAIVLGREAGTRASARIGGRKVAGGALPVLVENRIAGRLLAMFLEANTGAALQQKRSFLDGKLGARVAAEHVSVVDDPFVRRALGSRRFDSEGLTAHVMPIIDGGVLRAHYVNTYYGRKLGVAPTTGERSNVLVRPGVQAPAELERSIARGFVITGFLGGNSNALTGDFSLGFVGHLVEKGVRTQAVSEMNLAGNHREIWNKLAAIGNDPWTHASLRTPTLLFDGVSVT